MNFAGADFSEYMSTAAGAPGAAGILYITTATAAAAGVDPGNPFPGNVIPKSLLSPQALALLTKRRRCQNCAHSRRERRSRDRVGW